MQEKLILYIENSQCAGWAIIDVHEKIIRTSSSNTLDEIENIAENKEIYIFVSALDILLTKIQLPKMAFAKARKVAPFALEDRLIDELHDQHFSISQEPRQTETTVGIVLHEKMRQWLAIVPSHFKNNIKKIIPTTLAIPYSKNTWTLCVLKEIVFARVSRDYGFACDKENLEYYLANEEKPIAIHIFNYTNESLQIEQGPCEETFLSEEEFVHELAKNRDSANFNLLQGEYAPKKSKFMSMNKMLKSLTYFSFVCSVIVISYPIVSYSILQKKSQSLNLEIAKIYKYHFPNASSIIAPKQRLQEKLNKFQGENPSQGIIALLGQISNCINSHPDIRIRSFDFQNQQLHLAINALSSDDLKGFIEELQKQGLQVKQQNVNFVKDKINASLQIE